MQTIFALVINIIKMISRISKITIFIFLMSLIISCDKFIKNDLILQNSSTVQLTELTLNYTKDTSFEKNQIEFNSVINLKITFSITNNSNDSFKIKFNDLYRSDYNFELIGEIQGISPFKFYLYPLMFQHIIWVNRTFILPGETVVFNIETPILDILHNKKNEDIKAWFKKLDSLKVIIQSVHDSSIKKEMKSIGSKKILRQIDPPCLGKFNY